MTKIFVRLLQQTPADSYRQHLFTKDYPQFVWQSVC